MWEQIKAVTGAWREMFGSPRMFANLEEHCRRLEAWREKQNPGSNEAIRKFHAQMSRAEEENKARAASH